MFQVIFALKRVSLLASFVVSLAKSGHNMFLVTTADLESLPSCSKAALSTVSTVRRSVHPKLQLTSAGFDPK